jgi:hypothetical protein
VNNPKALSIKWIELILIALLVLGAMGVWVLIEQSVRSWMQTQAPNEKQLLQDAGVPALQVRMDLVQAEMNQVQEALVKERMSAAEKAAQMKFLAAQEPNLSTMAGSVLKGIPLSSATFQSYLDAKSKLLVAANMVNALEERMKALVDTSVTQTTTLQGLAKDSPDALATQSQLSMTTQELEKVQEELVTQRMEVTRQQAALHSLDSSYPQFAALYFSGQGNQAISPSQAAMVSTYLDLAITQQQSMQMIKALEDQQTQTIEQAKMLNTDLMIAQDKAMQRLAQDQEKFQMEIRFRTLLQASGWILLSLAIFWLFLKLTHRWFTNYPLNSWIICLAALIFTSILYAYQAFEYIGGALAGTLLLVASLIGFSAYQRKQNAALAGQAENMKTESGGLPLGSSVAANTAAQQKSQVK